MVKTHSNAQPNPYWIKQTSDTHHLVRLRRCVEEVERETEDGIITEYQYDEIEIAVPKRSDIDEYLTNNIEALFVAHRPEEAYAKIQLLEKDNADLWYEVMIGGV